MSRTAISQLVILSLLCLTLTGALSAHIPSLHGTNDATWEALVLKGTKLFHQMQSGCYPDTVNPLNRESLRAIGFTIGDDRLSQWPPIFQERSIFTESQVKRFKWSTKGNAYWRTHIDRSYPTPWSDASTFSLEVSPRNKILTALRPTIKSPVETVHWSDIAFAIWEATALTTHTPPQHLHFLAQQNNTNFLTHKVINRIVEGKPGEIKMFGQGTAIFHALLATDMGSRAVYFLMEHKRQLGHKTIAMVTVFGKTQAQWLQNGPDIVFELKDVAPAPDASARANGTFSAETEKLCQSIERQWGGEDADFLKRSESVLQNTE